MSKKIKEQLKYMKKELILEKVLEDNLKQLLNNDSQNHKLLAICFKAKRWFC